MSKIVLTAGRRAGHGSLSNDAEFRAKLGEGHEVYTMRNDMWFQATLDGDKLVYRALATAPDLNDL